MNFLQVYNKLEIPRTFTSCSGTFTFCMTTRPILTSSQSTQWKVPTHKKCFQSFPNEACIFSSYFSACFNIVQCLLQDFLGSDLFTESWKKEHFKTLLILELSWIFICMLYSLSIACKSRYCTCISWKRPVSARISVPRRPVPVWNLSGWAFCANFSLDCHFLCFQYFPSQFTACHS